MKCVTCGNPVDLDAEQRIIPYCSIKCRAKYYYEIGKEKTQDLIKKELLDK